jgi:hypothetical protein
MGFANDVADSVIYIDEGTIVEEGHPSRSSLNKDDRTASSWCRSARCARYKIPADPSFIFIQYLLKAQLFGGFYGKISYRRLAAVLDGELNTDEKYAQVARNWEGIWLFR